MARLIDADELKEWFLRPYSNEETYSNIDICSRINSAPTVDAVEVVRCKDCRWFGEEDEDDGQCWCFFNNVPTLRQGFCYFGERRKDERT